MSFLSKVFGKKHGFKKKSKPRKKGRPLAVFRVGYSLVIPKVGLFVKGEVTQGTIKEGMNGKGGKAGFTVIGIELNGEPVKTALDAQECSLHVSGLRESDLKKGMLLEFF